MMQSEKIRDVKASNGFQLVVVGLLSLCFINFVQAMEQEDKEGVGISKSPAEISDNIEEDNQSCLMALSDEVLLNIFDHLSPVELVNVSEVNCRMYSVSCDNQLWKKHILVSQRKGDSYKAVFKDLYQNPIAFQFLNNSGMEINFHFGYQYQMNESLAENMSNMVSLPHNGLLVVRKNDFSEEFRNSIHSSHCVYMNHPRYSQLMRIDYRQELPLGMCLVIKEVIDSHPTWFFNSITGFYEQKVGSTMLDFNTILPLQ